MKTYHYILLCIILFTTIISCSTNSIEPSPYNIILIMTDDQGYGDLSSHGNPHLKTPHIDALASESIRLTNYHAATTCSPTRAGLMTGVHCNRTGTWHTIIGRSFLSTRFPTIAEHLSEAGFETGIFGKWHLGDNYPYRPQDRGFTKTVIHGGGGVGQTPDYWNNDYFDDVYQIDGKWKQTEGFCTDVWFEEAIEFVDQKSYAGEPYFCYISTNAPHGPHHAPQASIDPYLNNDEIVSPNFNGQIANIDDNVGKLMAQLKSSGQLENTIVIFTTDNGTASGAQLDNNGQVKKGYNYKMRGKKVSEYEGGHRVPMFIRFPDKLNIIPQAFDELTTHTDVMPTILDILDIPLQYKDIDGRSIKPLLLEGTQKDLNERIVIVDTQRDKEIKKWKRSCIMQDQWRLVNQEELYDLKTDPSQLNNIITDHPELAKKLTAAYESWWTKVERDSKLENPIIIGHPDHKEVLLTCHDWLSESNSPWHQGHIRSGRVNNGFWKLQVHETGNYKIRLHRWPPSLDKRMNEGTPEGDPVSGGKPYAAGEVISIQAASIAFNRSDNSNSIEQQSADSVDGKYFEFEVTLTEGATELTTEMIADDKEVRGAYFVEIISMGA